MGRSCKRWNSGWFMRWRNLRKRAMKTTAVVTMKTESRPASRGSSGEFLWRWKPLRSLKGNELNVDKVKRYILEVERLKRVFSPSSPTFSSDGTSWCVGPAEAWPIAVVRVCLEAADTVDGCVGVGGVELCAMATDWDEKMLKRVLPSAVGACLEAELREVSVDERLSAAAEREDVSCSGPHRAGRDFSTLLLRL